jgi:hypothetical protein
MVMSNTKTEERKQHGPMGITSNTSCASRTEAPIDKSSYQSRHTT